jgi:hypothetical protein
METPTSKPPCSREHRILVLCYCIQVGLYSYNRKTHNALIVSGFDDIQAEVFWEMNLFDEQLCN